MELGPLRSGIVALCVTLWVPALLYVTALSAMIVAPSLQAHAIYLHKVTLTWFKDLNVPEQFGFAHHQATPFYIPTPDGVKLHAWHVLPLGAYLENQPALLAQGPDGGLVDEFETTLNFRLLRENPNARLVLYFHGTSGTMASAGGRTVTALSTPQTLSTRISSRSTTAATATVPENRQNLASLSTPAPPPTEP